MAPIDQPSDGIHRTTKYRRHFLYAVPLFAGSRKARKFSEDEELRWHEFFVIGRAELSQEQLAILVCREMGWSYDEYLQAPYRMIRSILHMLREESEETKRRSKA